MTARKAADLRKTLDPGYRLSAGGVADHFVSQLLRQDDPAAFKRYSQAKLNMMREGLGRLDRQANERVLTFGAGSPN